MKKENLAIIIVSVLIVASIVGIVAIKGKGNKTEPTAEPTKVAEATNKPVATAEPANKQDKEEDDDKVPYQEDGTTIKNPDGTEATADPNAEMPDLSEMSEGCYISPDGKEIWKDTEDGGVIVMWSPYNIDESLPEEEDERVDGDFSTPTVISKDSKNVAIIAADGSFKEVLDSNDEDYRKVYATVYGFDKACLGKKDGSVEKAYKDANEYLVDEYKYTEAEIQADLEENGTAYKYTESHTKYELVSCFFNADKTFCRINHTYQIQTDESGEMDYNNRSSAFNLKKVGDNWLICDINDTPEELEKLIPLMN